MAQRVSFRVRERNLRPGLRFFFLGVSDSGKRSETGSISGLLELGLLVLLRSDIVEFGSLGTQVDFR